MAGRKFSGRSSKSNESQEEKDRKYELVKNRFEAKQQEFLNLLVEGLESGVAPWRRGFDKSKATLAMSAFKHLNPTTGSPYRGSNKFWLAMQAAWGGFNDTRWMTAKQIADKGFSIKEGQEKNPSVIMWSQSVMVKTVKDEKTGEEKTFAKRLARPMFKTYQVYNADQIDGIEPFKDFLSRTQGPPVDKEKYLEILEQGCKAMGVEVFWGSVDVPCYRPLSHSICMPALSTYETQERAAKTLFHEMIHATSRELKRDLSTYGLDIRARAYEELVAEMGCFLSASEFFGDDIDPQNHQSYCVSWAKEIRQNPELFNKAMGEASKAAEFVLKSLPIQRYSAEDEAKDEMDAQAPGATDTNDSVDSDKESLAAPSV